MSGTSRSSTSSRATVALAALVLAWAVQAGDETPPDENVDAEALSRELAACAAYFFNAANAAPMKEYDALFRAGEHAYNRAVVIVGRKLVEHRMEEASAEQMDLIDHDWLKFGRVQARWGAHCKELVGFGRELD